MEKLCLYAMHLTLILFLLAAFLALSHGMQPPHGKKHNACTVSVFPASQEISPIIKINSSNTNLAFKFYHLITSQTPKKNALFSPLSISAAIAMLSLGADSLTRIHTLQVLGFNLTQMSEADIHQGFQHILHILKLPSDISDTYMGSDLFLNNRIQTQQKFVTDIKEFYESRVFQVNFGDADGTMKLINDLISNETQGKITDLVSEIIENTMMILVNYIYFQAQWKTPFNAELTQPKDFHVDEMTTMQVPMMMRMGVHRYLKDEHVPCSVLQLDYKDDAKLLLILPDPGKMEEVEAALTPQVLEKWKHSLWKRADSCTISSVNILGASIFYLPKFSISATYQLQHLLLPLGFTELFSPSANFSSISEQQNIKMTQGFHKAMLEVNEWGPRAIPHTGFRVFRRSSIQFPTINFNRPFITIIYSNKSSSILLVGKVVNPTI